MSVRIFALMGPPGSGKSTLMNALDKIPDFEHEVIPKISTRRLRDLEGKEIISIDSINSIKITINEKIMKFIEKYSKYYKFDEWQQIITLRGSMYFDEKKELLQCLDNQSAIKDTIEVEKLFKVANVMPQKYDFIYEQYNVRYGLSSEDIIDCLKRGKSPVVIVNDIRTIEDLKLYFGKLIVPLYLFRYIDDNEIIKLQKERGARDATGNIDETQIKRRIDKKNIIFRNYIENIGLFNHILLNMTSIDALVEQMKQIVNYYKKVDKTKSLNSKIDLNA